MTGRGTDWLWIGGLLAAALLLGLATNEMTLALLGGAGVWMALQQREFRALRRWSHRPLSRPDFRLARWDDIGLRLQRQIRRARRRTRRTLELSRALQDMTAALPDAAIMVDRNGHIEQINAAAETLLGLRRGDRGASLANLVRQPDFVGLIRGRSEAGLAEFASPFDDQLRLEARRIPLEGGHALILVRDVTQLNRLLTMRQDFVANVSHELRTPLTVVTGYLEALSEDDVDIDTLRQLIGRLEAPTRRMRALVDDLLLLSRLEANPPPGDADLAPVDVPTLLDACVAEARALTDERHRFCLDIDRTLRLRAIESELYSAALNMIVNAVRYSPDGGLITITWQRTPSDGAQLSGADEGIGIAPEHIQRITERFFRVDLARSRVKGGTGLGLAIVKHVLKRHRSRLDVASQPGRGSTFGCAFPAALVSLAGGLAHQNG
ncbi:MAG: phosphate regulon sensor histidine kinase PhoR, partial [Gammaproteobacteria bacterium]